jgi:hypothetical protein
MTTREKQMQALEAANAVRFGVARAKRELRLGERSLESVLRDPVCGSAKIALILAAQERWGAKRAGTLLDQLKITPLRRIDELTDRQLELIVKLAAVKPAQRWQIVAEHRQVAA